MDRRSAVLPIREYGRLFRGARKMKSGKPTTTPEEEGIELYPDAMERLERAIKTAVRRGPIAKDAISQKVRKRPPQKPRATPRRHP
jgi:hypothetical protein